MNLNRVRHIGSNMNSASTDNTSPAPRDIQTENVSVLSPASLGSWACFTLYFDKLLRCKDLLVGTYHP